VKQKEFGVKGPEVTIIGQGTWWRERKVQIFARVG
jgi:hypothetical protein